MRLILVRHAETVENASGIRMGHMPGKLSDLGIEQAKKVALRLKNEKIDCIYSSDLARAADTAKEIAKFHRVPFLLTERLREFDNGILRGKKRSEAPDIDWVNNTPEGGEPLSKGYDRAKEFIDAIYNKHRNETVLVVTHGYFSKAFVSVILDKPVEYFDHVEHLDNTSVSIFEFSEDKSHKVILYNDTKHLEV